MGLVNGHENHTYVNILNFLATHDFMGLKVEKHGEKIIQDKGKKKRERERAKKEERI